jgi:hypothetical protein
MTKKVRVIAINDGPVVNSPTFGDNIQAYKKGDQFEVISYWPDQIVVWHPLVGSTIALNSKNFITLQEYRNNLLDTII